MISNLRYELYDRLFSGTTDKELKKRFLESVLKIHLNSFNFVQKFLKRAIGIKRTHIINVLYDVNTDVAEKNVPRSIWNVPRSIRDIQTADSCSQEQDGEDDLHLQLSELVYSVSFTNSYSFNRVIDHSY